MTKHDVTRKQRVLDYIVERVWIDGYPPTVREIAEAVDLASTSSVHAYLRQLESDGLIERGAALSRGIRLTDKSSHVCAACGGTGVAA